MGLKYSGDIDDNPNYAVYYLTTTANRAEAIEAMWLTNGVLVDNGHIVDDSRGQKYLDSV